jgi:GTP-binding protein
MSLPVVAIVGRPNVGKSALFNRLIGYRKAIVDDQEGVTRDRHYAETEWSGRDFVVVDTGGYLTDTTDRIAAAVAEQVELAIAEADVIVLVTDVMSGLTELDRQVAKKLYHRRDKVLLAVNKVDNESWQSDAAAFYALGLGDPHPLSAIQGRMIGDFLDQIIALFPTQNGGSDREFYFDLTVIGKENVGKSSFINALLGDAQNIVTEIPGTTRDSIDSILNYHGKKIRLIDTAGLKRRAKIKENVLFFSALRTQAAIQRSDVIAYFFDVNAGLAHYDLQLIKEALEKGKAVVVVANKWDLYEKSTKTTAQLERDYRARLGHNQHVPIVFTSMHSKQRLGKILQIAEQRFLESNRKIPTSELNAKLLPEIVATPPPSRQGKEIKIKYITQLGQHPPVFGFFARNAKLIDENYRRFLENRLRNHFGFSGIPVIIACKEK